MALWRSKEPFRKSVELLNGETCTLCSWPDWLNLAGKLNIRLGEVEAPFPSTRLGYSPPLPDRSLSFGGGGAERLRNSNRESISRNWSD